MLIISVIMKTLTSPPHGNHPIKVEGNVADAILNTGQMSVDHLTINHNYPHQANVLDLAQLRREFYQCGSLLRIHKSTIGHTGKHMTRGVVGEIVRWAKRSDDDLTQAHHHNKGRIGVLLDGAGMGKTTVMRDVLLQLENEGFCVLAVKCDQQLSGISDAATVHQHLGISVNLQESTFALAQEGPVAIIVDQIDALSLALSRDQRAMDAILATVANLSTLQGGRILLSCRTFDLKSDPRLKNFEDCQTFALPPIDDNEVCPFLEERGLAWTSLAKATQELLRQPLALDLFITSLESRQNDADILDRGYAVTTLQDVYRLLWDSVIRRDDRDAPSVAERENVIEKLAQRMVEHAKTSAPKSLFSSPENSHLAPAVRWLASAGILVEADAEWAFIHQTFIDYCAAKSLVESGADLCEFILNGDQDLIARTRLLQTIVYLRGSDSNAYLIQLYQLLNAPSLREHLRVLLFGWFGALQNPGEGEWNLAKRLLAQDPQRLLLLDWMGNNPAWLQRLQTDFLPMWLEVEGEFLDQHVLPFLSSFTESAQDEVATLFRPYAGRSREWNGRLVTWTGNIREWRAPKAVELFESAVVATIADIIDKNEKIVFGYMMGLKQLVTFNPAACCRILRSMLDGLLSVFRDHRDESKYPDSDNEHLKNSYYTLPERLEGLNGGSARDLLEELPRRNPQVFLEQMVPWLEDAVGHIEGENPLYDEYHYAHDEFYDAWRMGGSGTRRLIAGAIVQSLANVALQDPHLFTVYVDRLATHQSISPHQILVQAFQIVHEPLADQAAFYLMGDKRRFDIGDRRRDDSRELAALIAPHLSPETQEKLQKTIIEASRDWKRFTWKGSHHLDWLGRDELFLLEAIPAGCLTPEAQVVARELRRKFPDAQVPDASGDFRPMRQYTALSMPKALRISDKAWLRIFHHSPAFQTPSDSLKRRDQHRQISSLSLALIDSIVARPERFWKLFNHLRTTSLCESLSMNHRNAFIQGFGSAATPLGKRYGISKVTPNDLATPEDEWEAPAVVPAEWFFEVLRSLAPEPGLQGYAPSYSASWQDIRQSIGRHLDIHVENLPFDLVEMLESYVRRPPFGDVDPDDTFEKERTRIRTSSAHDSRNAVINHERGACFETLMRVHDKQKSTEYEHRRWTILEFVATDPSPILRVAAIEELKYHLQHDCEWATRLFEAMCNGFPELMRAADTREFLYWSMRGQFLRLSPFIMAMLDTVLSHEEVDPNAHPAALAQKSKLSETVIGEDSMHAWIIGKRLANQNTGNVHDEECAQNGAELVCLAALSDQTSDKQTGDALSILLEECLNGPSPWRRGVAHIAVHNLKTHKARICVEWLYRLMHDEDDKVRTQFSSFFRLAAQGAIALPQDYIYAFAREFASSPALLNNLNTWKKYLWFVSQSKPEDALTLVELMLQNPHRRRERLYGTEDWMRLALRVYTDPLCNSAWRERGLSVFDQLMGENRGIAHQLLLEWDKR